MEINDSFYRFPSEKALKGWADRSAEDFLFTVKANQRITHGFRLKNVEAVTASFTDWCKALGPRLGCILFQLPPDLRRDDARLMVRRQALRTPRGVSGCFGGARRPRPVLPTNRNVRLRLRPLAERRLRRSCSGELEYVVPGADRPAARRVRLPQARGTDISSGYLGPLGPRAGVGLGGRRTVRDPLASPATCGSSTHPCRGGSGPCVWCRRSRPGVPQQGSSGSPDCVARNPR